MANTFSSQIAADDTVWTYVTSDIGDLLSLFSNPHQWVQEKVNKTLTEHFVMQFTSFDQEGTKGDDFVIQGIDNTALVTVRYSGPKLSVRLEDSEIFDSVVGEGAQEILEVRLRSDFGLAYAHQEWGSNPDTIGLRLLYAASNTAAYLESLSTQPQTVDEETNSTPPTPLPDVRIAFVAPENNAIAFTFEGSAEWYRQTEGDPEPAPITQTACGIDTGTFDQVAQPVTTVVVDNVIVKTYAMTPPPPPIE